MPIRRKIGNLDSAYKQSYSKDITRTISDFLNTDYRAYSQYVIENRAIPSIMDGFKVGGRKILHAAFKGSMREGKETKMLNLVGDVYKHTLFMHGDSSLIGAIFTASAEYNDNLNPIEITGQHGTLRDSSSHPAARYLSCKLSKFAKLYKIDEDLLNYVFYEGEYLEPEHYLPVIPTVLTAHSEGMAPGYRFSCFSYNPLDVIDACIDVIKAGKVKTQIRPYVRGIDPSKFSYDKETNKWWNVGTWEFDTKNDVLQITDLPYDVTFEKFEKKLNNYVDNGYIKDWKDFSHDGKLDYRIVFPKTKLAREIQADKIEQTLKKFLLQSTIPDDLLYVLDENKKIKHFACKEDLLTYFVHVRQNKYNERKDRLVNIKEQQLKENSDMCKFIELVTSGKLKINNRKIADVKADLDTYELPEKMLQVQISKLTEEEKQAILKKNQDIMQELEYIKNTTIEQMYIDDLKALKKELATEF